MLPLAVGCDDRYAADMTYPLRSDPIIIKPPTTESPLPDRPGVLPVMNFKSLELPTHPLHSMLSSNRPLDPNDLDPQDRGDLERTLLELFGTPAAPKVAIQDADLAARLSGELRLTEDVLVRGSQYYRLHCLHCHGLTGDGRGPTAFWINPHPRDYRRGAYKFVSTSVIQGGAQRPRREDLVRTIHQGLDGTAMPSFSTLPEEQIDAMVSYIIHLGLRGEVEQEAMRQMLTNKPGEREWTDNRDMIMEWLPVFANYWLDSQRKNGVEALVVPDPYPYTTDEEFAQSVVRGWRIFITEKDKGGGDCLKCHIDYGRRSLYRFDDWGTMVRPADLTTGIYRGGRRPLDLYWRIHNGITGSGMIRTSPSEFKVAGAEQGKTHPLWDLVNFLQVLPYPQMREKYGIQIN